MPHGKIVENIQQMVSEHLVQEKDEQQLSALDQIIANKQKVGILFVGQGFDFMTELAELYEYSPRAKEWIRFADQLLRKWSNSPEILSKGLFSFGLTPVLWVEEQRELPSSYLLRVSVSHPLILMTQLARLYATCDDGLEKAFDSQSISLIAGYSQGLIPALFASEEAHSKLSFERAAQYLQYTFWQGVIMENHWQRLNKKEVGTVTPMAAISGIEFSNLEAAVSQIESVLEEGEYLSIAIQSTRTRFVVSGPSSALALLRAMLERQQENQEKKKKQGQYGGNITSITWETVPVSGAFHNLMMEDGIIEMRAKCKEIGFTLDAEELSIPVLCYDDGSFLSERPDPLEYLMAAQFVLPVRWFSVMSRVAREKLVDFMLDMGPGDGLCRLSASTLRGSGIESIALKTAAGQQRLFTAGSPVPHIQRYDDFRPRIVESGDGDVRIDNSFAQATGRPPIILPGMTPTTVDVEIVAAAANAGYVAELAGGGQVNEDIFWKRMEELREELQPGQGVVFNALFLDRYLWGLHFGKQNLVIKARQAGYPICGVTISAGIPELDEAVELFRNFHANGIWLNALKAGNVPQVKQIIQIAKALPEQKIFLHLEGGKAGGHHSWENLDHLLLDTYHLIRSCPNLILCVGGGIATEERATDLLYGNWSSEYQLIDMPVDAVLLGTICMAVKEAKTSPQVKKALAEAAGHVDWVYAGTSKGNITSGKSQLNADIHYVDNRAARCGRLLDSVAGNEEAVEQRREEIIEVLNGTAKPYFGDLQQMTYSEVLNRMMDLMAIGRHDRYEDGCWPDRSFRQRFADMLWRAEARLHLLQEGEFLSVLTKLSELDQPQDILKRFLKEYPSAHISKIHPADANYFVSTICRRPGKPVNFVPMIDADVRRWYKSDSLWQSHDDRFEADQVLIIPGPEAVAGIQNVDEPIASLFARFRNNLSKRIQSAELPAQKRDQVNRTQLNGLKVSKIGEELKLTLTTDDVDWHTLFSSSFNFGVFSFWGAAQVLSGDRLEHNIVRKICVPRKGGSLIISENKLRCQPNAEREAWITVEELGKGDICVQIFDVSLTGTEKPLLTQHYHPHITDGEAMFRIEDSAKADSIMNLYHNLLFDSSIPVTALFATATDESSFTESEIQGYMSSLGERGIMPPLNFMFSLGWKPIFSVLSCTEIRGGLLDLVHLSNDVSVGEAWPPSPNEKLELQAKIFRLETKGGGQAVSVSLTIHSKDGLIASLISEFFIRRAPHRAIPRLLISKEWSQEIRVENEAEVELLKGLSFLEWSSFPKVGQTIDFQGTIIERHPWGSSSIFKGTGEIFVNGAQAGIYSVDERSMDSLHPMMKLVELFSKEKSTTTAVRRLIIEEKCWAPANMAAYAKVSRDQNPIHQSPLFARLAGLDAPIVHGMWTAGKMHSLLRKSLDDDAQLRIREFKVSFDAPLPLTGELRIQLWKTGYIKGEIIVEIRAVHLTEDGREEGIAQGRALILPLKTAYVFPGQGIQEQNMGMELYKSSAAAKVIWNRADAHTRHALGFSILRVVQNNPKILRVGRSSFRHPNGVLHLTQFTQVAMATMAQAQVAWMKEEGVFISGAVTCGHSVGEYNAISAVLQALPLEETISIVWQRGLTMHTLVERDEKGRSAYKMGVIRPHYAGMNHQECEELVQEIQNKTGKFLEIVNYNVRGRQYSVTGEIAALEALSEALEARNKGVKKAYIDVPGIDVPFHSTLLTNGVPDFRETLKKVFPDDIDPKALVGCYIPNLTASVFQLTREYVEEILSVVDSEPMNEVLKNWDLHIQEPSKLARAILIELLAWQFASPVRWIESQECMFASRKHGGLELQEIIEIGSGKQPTLANMAKYSLSLQPIPSEVQIFNVESEKERLFGVDTVVLTSKEDISSVEEESASIVEEVAPVVVMSAPSSSSTLIDQSISHQQGLIFLIAKQSNCRSDQITAMESIEEIFEGVSSKRNQVLLDLGSEFSVGVIDAAQDKTIDELSTILTQRSPSWRGGSYLLTTVEEACKKVFGRANISQSDVTSMLEKSYGLPSGLQSLAWMTLALECREGVSNRGGDLGRLTAFPANRKSSEGFLAEWMTLLGSSLGISIGVQGSSSSGGAVDSALLEELKDSILGKDGVLMKNLHSLAEELGHDLQPNHLPKEGDGIAEALLSEMSTDYAEWIEGIFDPEKHAPFISVWAAAHSATSRLLHQAVQGTLSRAELMSIAERLADFSEHPRVNNAARWARQQVIEAGREELTEFFDCILEGNGGVPLPIVPSRPKLTIGAQGEMTYEEVLDLSEDSVQSFVNSYCAASHCPELSGFEKSLHQLASQAGDFSELTVLMTGASPGSIAVEILRQLLRGNARVVVTTTSCNANRMRFYRDLYNRDGGPDSQLHVLPYNQASISDSKALVDWLFESESDLRPNLILPFGAIKSYGSLADLNGGSEAAMRAMLTGVESLIAGVGGKMLQEGGGHCHVILPLSPNHGIFGGDGLYAESKAALEVLLNKCQSEQKQWAQHISICGAVIGWVRGTGLMNANNVVAAQLEERLSIQTFSPAEMGLLISSLCQKEMAELCQPTLRVDLSGGLMAATQLREEVDNIRAEMERTSSLRRQLHGLKEKFIPERSDEQKTIRALPNAGRTGSNILFPSNDIPLSEMVVIVGYGEVSPCGSARTRYEMELQDELAPGAVAELAWITGMIRYENDAWIDVETSEVVDEADIAGRYRTAIEGCTGIRFLKPETVGFDTQAVETWTLAFLDKPYRFAVSSKEEAECFVTADPEKTEISYDGEWYVTMKAGAQIRLPKHIRFSRSVGGAIPDGFDFSRYGIPMDMQDSVDKVTLFNLVATVDAWISAGLTPEELMQHIHPARIGNTQSSGIGGMGSLTKLYTDPLMDRERQNDVLQETLLNVMAAYVVQSYVGSYGPMSHPVGACATAALSVESGMEKILLGKADFVVTGGFDDLGIEGMFGFADMNATAPTQEMLDKGFEPKEFSRSNDIRRGGFVESQGGGTILLARGDLALEMGLPVRGVIACAGSFSDGVHRSIPAPGRGLLAIATGKEQSQLAQSLDRFGLNTNDINVVYKHDTSTTANDVNENEIHHRIQEHLERKEGNPLWVVSQKSITGHSKGGAAAWQIIGLCQALEHQRIPGNRNLSCVDPVMRGFGHMCFLNEDLTFSEEFPIRAGMVTSLGFGHVSAGLLILHPQAFLLAIPEDQREEFIQRAGQRQRQGDHRWEEIRMGKSEAFSRAQHRRFRAKDGSKEQAEEESSMLLNPESRLAKGIFQA